MDGEVLGENGPQAPFPYDVVMNLGLSGRGKTATSIRSVLIVHGRLEFLSGATEPIFALLFCARLRRGDRDGMRRETA